MIWQHQLRPTLTFDLLTRKMSVDSLAGKGGQRCFKKDINTYQSLTQKKVQRRQKNTVVIEGHLKQAHWSKLSQSEAAGDIKLNLPGKNKLVCWETSEKSDRLLPFYSWGVWLLVLVVRMRINLMQGLLLTVGALHHFLCRLLALGRDTRCESKCNTLIAI